MTPSTPAAHCECCGATTAELDDYGHCLDCENVRLQTDAYAVDVALNIIEVTVRKTLELNYVHSDDVLARVGKVIREQGDTHAQPLGDLLYQLRRNNAHAVADRGAP